MHWKQITLTALVTLLVTIISGVAVNWYTNNIKEKPKELLVYDIKSIAQFDSDSTDISIFTLEVINEGAKVAENVDVKLIFDKESEIIDSKGVLQRTNESIHNVWLTENSLHYRIPRLFQDDRFFLNVAFKNLTEEPQIIIESPVSVGKIMEAEVSEKEEEQKKQLIGILSIGLAAILLAIIFLSMKIVNRFYQKSLNNTGYLFLHKGQYKMAIDFFEKAMSRGADYFELSNYALAKCLEGGSKSDYEPLMEMAEFIANVDDFQLSFTRMLIAAKEKEYTALQSNFEIAYKKNKKKFKVYYGYSRILTDLAAKDPELIKFKDQLEKKHNLI